MTKQKRNYRFEPPNRRRVALAKETVANDKAQDFGPGLADRIGVCERFA
jgi:hypothetical protein